MKAKKINSLYIGFADLTIKEIYGEYPQFFEGSSILITCLDSSRNLNRLWKWKKHLEGNKIRFKRIGLGFWFDNSMLNQLFELNKTFFGFDEIYLFENNSEPKIYPQCIFTSDGYNFSDFIPEGFFSTFRDTGAIAYLSDGCGLNFASIRDIDLERIQKIEELKRSKI